MTTCEEIRDLWRDEIFAHASIQTLTTQALFFEVMPESEGEISEIYCNAEINFFECVITRGVTYPLIGGADNPLHTFLVEVRYTREKDPTGDNYIALSDGMNTLVDLVQSELSGDWSGLVDYALPQEAAPQVSAAKVAGKDCFRAVYRFQATKLN